MMSWPYFELRADGYLYDEDGTRQFDQVFFDSSEAEQWLEDQDIRGSVR